MNPILAEINLKGGWDNLWVRMQNGLPSGITNLMTAIAAGLVVFALFKFFNAKRSGGGGMGGGGGGAGKADTIMWSLVVAAMLAGPEITIPIILTLIDALINAFIGAAGIVDG